MPRHHRQYPSLLSVRPSMGSSNRKSRVEKNAGKVTGYFFGSFRGVRVAARWIPCPTWPRPLFARPLCRAHGWGHRLTLHCAITCCCSRVSGIDSIPAWIFNIRDADTPNRIATTFNGSSPLAPQPDRRLKGRGLIPFRIGPRMDEIQRRTPKKSLGLRAQSWQDTAGGLSSNERRLGSYPELGNT